MWVANSLDGTVSRIDPQTNRVTATIPVGDGPAAIAVGAGGVWVANEFAGTVARIDPATDTVTRTITVGNRPRGVAIAGGLVWVGAQASAAEPPRRHADGAPTRPVRLPRPGRPGSLASILTLYMTNDGLTAYKQVGGSDGAQLVPDLAISLPTPTDGGTHLHVPAAAAGSATQTAQPVRPEDFRRAIERDLVLGPERRRAGRLHLYENVVGGAACVATPGALRPLARDRHRRRGQHGHLSPRRARPRVPRTARARGRAVAVPAGTPEPRHRHATHCRRPARTRSPAHAAPGHARAQPLLPRVVARGATGRLPGPDRVADSAPAPKRRSQPSSAAAPTTRSTACQPTACSEVQTRFASQLHVNPNDVTILMRLNTRVAPFNDVRVRRALNYAIDRAELARLLGQESRPTCQMLPPYIPGYQPLLPLHAQPQPRRDVERARPRQGQGPDRRLGHPRHADHDLEPAARLLSHGLHRRRTLPRLAA